MIITLLQIAAGISEGYIALLYVYSMHVCKCVAKYLVITCTLAKMCVGTTN